MGIGLLNSDLCSNEITPLVTHHFHSYFLGEYGGWRQAVDAGDYRSVFVLAEPLKIPRHNFYEFIWLLKTGAPRVVSVSVKVK